MRILFFTDNFPPESNAPATRTYEHCVEWVKKGAEVTVITCVPNYPLGKVFTGYKNKFFKQEETMDGIRVIRVWTYVTPNRGTVKRILDYISFAISAFFASIFIKTDIIIATSPQLFAALGGYLSAKMKRKKWIMEIRDLWPESIKAVGAMDQRRIIKFIDQIVLFLYRKADHAVVVTESFKDRLKSCGVPENKITIVKNGVHLHKFQNVISQVNLKESLNLNGKFIVAYIGTHGMAHKLDFIIDCAAKVKDHNIHFLFIGEGAMKSRLVRQASELDATNVTLLDGISKEMVPQYIDISDVALVNLRNTDTFKKVLPSKIFENAAMQKPILLGVDGEARELVEAYNAGLYFEPENEKDFLEKLTRIHTDRKLYEDLQKGCIKLVADFDRGFLADKMYQVIKNLYQSKNVISAYSPGESPIPMHNQVLENNQTTTSEPQSHIQPQSGS